MVRMGSRLEKNSHSVRKRIEGHTFEDEAGEEYEGSKFGGFPEYFRRKKIKLQNLDAQVRSESVGKPQIFRGVVAHVNGYTQPSLNDLHHLIVSHGGGFMQYLDGKTTVTHIIAANLTPKKAIEFRRYRMVKPAWIVDSVAAGKLLPWDTYRVLDEGAAQRLLGFDEGKIVSQISSQQKTYREQTNTSWYTSQVKTVAENIDHVDGAHFPSTQAIAFNGLSSLTTDHSERRNDATQKEDAPATGSSKEDLDSSGSFEVTSSLEAVLNESVKKDAVLCHEDDSTESIPADTVILPVVQAVPLTDSVVVKTSEERGSECLGLTNTRDKHNQGQLLETSASTKNVKVMTAEEHNALLLADPYMRKSSTANPDFIQQYYSESRLHHLSAWKADLKSRFQQMAAEQSASQKQTIKRKPGARRYIMHVDFDSFFCAVSLKSAPEFVDKPAVVAHGSGTGSEIASCNYAARAFGIKNGMWMKNAHKLCPNIKVLPYDFPAYEEASKGFYEAILNVGGIVQSVSVDEALVDITSLCLPAGGTDGSAIREGSIWREQEMADDIALKLRARIKDKTGCAVSIGIGGNILLAKVALRKAKPAGQHHVKPEDVLDFIGDLDVQNLPGVAHSIGGKLEEIGVKFVKDVRQLTKDRLTTILGPKTGEKIWDYSRGIDRTEVGEQAVRKSVSAEVNWGIRFISQAEAEDFVQNLCIELQRRLIDQRVKGRQITMKIMRKSADAPMDPPKNLGHGKCDVFNKSIVLGVATNSADVIGREAISVLRSYGFSPGELRGLGVQMTKLEALKISTTLPDGSQRRINFGAPSVPSLKQSISEDPIDDPQTPRKSTPSPLYDNALETREDHIDTAVTPLKTKSSESRFLSGGHALEDIESPEKLKYTSVHPAAAIWKANAEDRSAKKVLNVTGTQFIIPSQLDPKVLLELPQDIRSRLISQSKSRPLSRSQSPAIMSRSQSPDVLASKPLPSQLDPEVFEALPEDMKAEVLASYAAHHTTAPSRAQSLLPQSPRKVRTVHIPTKRTTPTKPRGRGRPPGAKGRLKQDPHSTLMQSNLVAPLPRRGEDDLDSFSSKDHHHLADTEGGDDYSPETLDPDFLIALPPDVREEVLAEHKRKRLARRGGLGLLTTMKKPRRPPDALLLPLVQRKLQLSPREPRPTFTTQELSVLSELRETLSSWHQEFADDGPHPDDVAAMERYLKRVVLDERDMSKVVGVVRWLSWLVDEADERSTGTRIWAEALRGIKEKVQEAVRERGLGRLDL